MLTENDLRGVLHEFANDAKQAFPAADVSDAGHRLALSLPDAHPSTSGRRLRTWLAPLAGVAATIALTAGVIAALHGHDTAVAPQPTRVTPVAATPTSSTPAPVAAAVTITPQWAVQTLVGLLPSGKISWVSASASRNEVDAIFNYDDGHGVAGVGISVKYPIVSTGPLYERNCGPDQVAGNSPTPRCTTITASGVAAQCLAPGVPTIECGKLPAGSQVHEDSTAEARSIPGWTPHPGDPDSWTVALLRPDGLDVQIDLQNGPMYPKFLITRSAMLISEERMLAIAADKIWTATIPADAAKAAAHLFTPSPTLSGEPVVAPVPYTPPATTSK